MEVVIKNTLHATSQVTPSPDPTLLHAQAHDSPPVI